MISTEQSLFHLKAIFFSLIRIIITRGGCSCKTTIKVEPDPLANAKKGLVQSWLRWSAVISGQ